MAQSHTTAIDVLWFMNWRWEAEIMPSFAIANLTFGSGANLFNGSEGVLALMGQRNEIYPSMAKVACVHVDSSPDGHDPI